MWREHSVKSPKILDFSWGRLVIEGYKDEFKDAKLYPGGARDWDWSETGTRHVPGIQPADVHELLREGAEVVVLSRGVQEQLQTCPETLELLNERDIETYVLQTEQAIEKYNQLVAEN
ncbi:MAG: Mth938-like domain-containing protein, partial [Chloroflexi bacterium]|nr:Mth938-like domain-containing protein [Chloroflexota bacterium]